MKPSIIFAREFLELRLPLLLKDRELVDVLVVMGQASLRCKPGEAKVGKRGLRIYSQLSISDVNKECPFTSAFEAPTPARQGVIVIAFAGTQDLTRLALFAHSLHIKNEGVQTVLATCDCGGSGLNDQVMLPLLEKEAIIAAVETSDCTGVTFISDAVEKLIAAWQPPAPGPIPR